MAYDTSPAWEAGGVDVDFRPRSGGSKTMTDLLSSVLDADGGLARWRAFDMVEAIFMFGGQLVQTKVSSNLPATPTTGPTSRVEMSTREQSGTRIDTTGSGQRVRYSRDRVAVENLD